MRPASALVIPILCLLLAIVSMAAGAAFAKSLFPVMGATGTTAARAVMGALIVFVLLRGWRARLTRDNWKPLAIYGVTLGGTNLFFFISLTTLPLGIASAIEFLGPLSVSVIFSQTRKDYFWAALAVLGLVLLMPIAGSPDALDPIGICWALASAACWALYIVYGRQAGEQHGQQAVALGMTAAALVIAPLGVAEAGPALFDIALLPTIIALAVLSSAIPISLEMISLQGLPPRTFGVLLSIEPAISAVIGFVLLDEALTIRQMFAIAFVVIACAGAAASARSDDG